MSCNDVLDRIEELVDDLLPPEEADWRHAHIRTCTECAECLAESKRFHALIAAEGSDALQDWHAQRLAAQAAIDAAAQPAVAPAPAARSVRPRVPQPAAEAPIHALPLWRRAGARYAAAAAVLAAGLIVGVGSLGTTGPYVLAAGKPITLSAGTEAATGPGRGLRAERTLRISVEPGTDGARVTVEGGAALFRIEQDRHCHVATPGGVAKADGSTFLLEVRQDSSVAVTVLAGEVRFDRDDGTLRLASGDRVEVDVDRRAHVVSRARLDELGLASEMASLDAAALHGEVDQLTAEITALRAVAGGAAETAGGGAAQPADLPWDDLGAALRAMLGHGAFSADADNQKATGVFLVHAAAIRELTGVRHPLDALTHPAFLEGVATGFMDALAPDTHVECRAAAADAMRAAAQRLQFVLDSDPVPTDLLAARQRLARDVLVAVRQNLGEEAADEVAGDLPRGWDSLRATPMDRSDAAIGVAAWWTRKLALDESQASAIAPLVERYVRETVAVQTVIEDRLGAEQAARILYPARRGGFGPRRGVGAPGAGDHEGGPREPRTERPRVTVDERLNHLDAELDVARPRIEFERAVLGLLRADQRERGLGKSFGLPTFRPAVE